MSVCNVYNGDKWIPIEESTYCPIITAKTWPMNWYKWLSFVSDKEFEYISNNEELLEINKKRLKIANLILKFYKQRLFSYYEQQEVEQYTKENDLDKIIEEKLSYFNETEREKIKKKILEDE